MVPSQIASTSADIIYPTSSKSQTLTASTVTTNLPTDHETQPLMIHYNFVWICCRDGMFNMIDDECGECGEDICSDCEWMTLFVMSVRLCLQHIQTMLISWMNRLDHTLLWLKVLLVRNVILRWRMQDRPGISARMTIFLDIIACG